MDAGPWVLWAIWVLETLASASRAGWWSLVVSLSALDGRSLAVGMVSSAVFDFSGRGWGRGCMQVAGWETPGMCLHHFYVQHLLSLGAAAFSGFSVFCERRTPGKGQVGGLACMWPSQLARVNPTGLPMLGFLTTLMVTSHGYSVLSTSCLSCPSRPFPKVEGHVCGFFVTGSLYLSCAVFTLG